MKRIRTIFACTLLLAISTTTATAQTGDALKAEAIKASYLLALGKPASQGEVNYWMGQNLSGNQMVRTLVENHRQYLQQNPALKKDMIRRSFKNAYGRDPLDKEVNENMGQNYIYADWISNHIAWLRKTPGDYENVIRNAYVNVMRRQPQQGEMSYWKQKGAMAYFLLASCVENCRKTSGSSTCAKNELSPTSIFATVQAVSGQIASQSAAIIGSAASNVVAPGGGNVVAPGGGNVVASGGLN